MEGPQAKPVILGQFPEFSRKTLDFDESNKQELINQAFPQGYMPVFQKRKPNSSLISGY
jgi:hypothetical protein